MKGLATDIGGTNARLAIVQDLEIEIIKIYPTKKFKSALELFSKFQEDIGDRLPSRWAVAAAGVTTSEMIRGTNIGWDIVKEELKDFFQLETCILLNDFEAAAYGLATLNEKKLVRIGGNLSNDKGTRALLGAGTGLGEAICIYCGDEGWKVIRSEGGHCSFAPTDETEIGLLQFLKQKYGHVSYERILSGTGLIELYEFFAQKTYDTHQNHYRRPIKSPAQITELAKKNDELCQRVIGLFCRILGEEAGNLALKSLPDGGIFIGGGIPPRIISWLKKGQLRKGFEEKGRMTNLLQELPIFVVDEPYLGIYGGAYKLQLSLNL